MGPRTLSPKGSGSDAYKGRPIPHGSYLPPIDPIEPIRPYEAFCEKAGFLPKSPSQSPSGSRYMQMLGVSVDHIPLTAIPRSSKVITFWV